MLTVKSRIAAGILGAAAVIAAAAFTAYPDMRQEVVISVAGDILLDRGVATELKENGADYPYREVSAAFLKDDITVANLECPLTSAGGGAMKAKRFVFKAAPDNAEILKDAGFDALMLANNHTMDYVSDGLADTMSALDAAGLFHAGAGQNKQDIKPCYITDNGVCIGLLSYSCLPLEGIVYDKDSPTIAYARAGSLDSMKSEIKGAREQCDFLIVYFHWGTEFRHDVSDAQIEIAHAAVDSGASAVIGAHPHVLQGKENYNGAPIYYSLGNFVFDKQIPYGTDESLIVQFTVAKNGILSVKEFPVIIENVQPQIAQGQRALEIAENFIQYSSAFEQ
jgi:poly-gamma-glutamate synthesis protein (capsule biosynthesis protein)